MHHMNRKKDKNHMVTSIDTEKLLEKIQYSCMIKKKKINKSGIERNFPNLIEGIYELP